MNSNKKEYNVPASWSSQLPHGTTAWGGFISSGGMQQGPGSSQNLSAVNFGPRAQLTWESSCGIRKAGAYGIKEAAGLDYVVQKAGMQKKGAKLPPLHLLPPYLRAAKTFPIASLHFKVFGDHEEDVTRTHDPLGASVRQPGPEDWFIADPYAQLIIFYLETGTCELDVFLEYFRVRLLKTPEESLGPWQGYVDWKLTMTLFLTGHDEASMRECAEYKRVHGFLLKQWRDQTESHKLTAEAKAADIVYANVTPSVEKLTATAAGGSAGGIQEKLTKEAMQAGVAKAFATTVVSSVMQWVTRSVGKEVEELKTTVELLSTRLREAEAKVEATEKKEAGITRGFLRTGGDTSRMVIGWQMVGIPCGVWSEIYKESEKEAAANRAADAFYMNMPEKLHRLIYVTARLFEMSDAGADDGSMGVKSTTDGKMFLPALIRALSATVSTIDVVQGKDHQNNPIDIISIVFKQTGGYKQRAAVSFSSESNRAQVKMNIQRIVGHCNQPRNMELAIIMINDSNDMGPGQVYSKIEHGWIGRAPMSMGDGQRGKRQGGQGGKGPSLKTDAHQARNVNFKRDRESGSHDRGRDNRQRTDRKSTSQDRTGRQGYQRFGDERLMTMSVEGGQKLRNCPQSQKAQRGKKGIKDHRSGDRGSDGTRSM